MRTVVHLLTNSSRVIFGASRRAKDPNNASAAARKWTKQLSPNMSTRSGFAQSPACAQCILHCLSDMFIRVFVHQSSYEEFYGQYVMPHRNILLFELQAIRILPRKV